MESDAIYEILAHGGPSDRAALVAQLPPDDLSGRVAALVQSTTPGMPVVALAMLAMKYCNGRSPEVGAPLALALHRRGIEIVESRMDPNLLLGTVGNLAFQYVNASGLLGRSDEVVRFTNQWIPFYEARGETQSLPSLKAARISAYLNRNEPDTAEALLADPTLRGNPATDIEVIRLEGKLRVLKAAITDIRPASAAAAPAGHDAEQAIARAVAELASSVGGLGDGSFDMEAITRLAAPGFGNPANPETFKHLLETLRGAEPLLTGGSDADSRWTIQRRVREAAGIFVTSPSPPVETINASLADLQECLTWARAHSAVDLVTDALWGIYLCHSRLKQPSPAADALIQLRHELEARRQGIADPLKRGGVFAEYPHLFDALCEKLHLAGRIPELLEAIEAAKGRGIADILTQKANRPIADSDIYAAVRNLPQLTVKHGFHYLTFYVDDERTYIVLVTKRGAIRAPDPVPLGRTAIRDAARQADPRGWGQPTDENPSVLIGDTSQALAALVSWLLPLWAAGEIADGDHLCYVADEDVANVPLHYLSFGDGTLADRLSISKIHGAFHLDLLLNQEAKRPPAFLGVVVPTKQNLERRNWPEMKRALWQPIDWLRARMPGEIVADGDADGASLAAETLRERVVHFSTHGVFPEATSPFETSGVVLAEGGELPDESVVAAGQDRRAVLTPSKVLESAMDLSGSHVSLMACVSGLSREGRGGDALGLEWALIQAGASSVLASHWYVSARLAAEFFERFYGHWMVDGMSRAASHARAISELRQSYGAEAMAAWAAFSLAGDWR